MSFIERVAAMPSHFWSVVFFVFGSAIGSFLNVCIHRMPRGESIVSPPSHCPGCNARIPWHLNLPLISWLALRGRCARCGVAISVRYFLVELLTGLLFLGCWLAFGRQSAGLAIAYALFLAGLVVATFIDFEHFIIPDEITLGGVGVGFVASILVPALHGTNSPVSAAKWALLGTVVGWALMYGILRLGKLLFGREHLQLEPGSRIHFGEQGITLPDRTIPYEEVFYRAQDTIRIDATRVELVDRCYGEAPVRLSQHRLQVAGDEFEPEEVPFLEVTAERLNLPREAMGLGDVKFMMAFGAFLGWGGVIFSLMASAMIGAAVGISAIAVGRREWSSRIPFGPYLALAAAIWIFAGEAIVNAWLGMR
ncbi:MAG: prepilin peptidase [Verrucomicrobiales bacterium]|nr:prepilin peptidase [Verrucomicrobiales bacterium]